MIRVHSGSLSPAAQHGLNELQRKLNLVGEYQEQVREASVRFRAENRRGNRTFDEVKRTLEDMCSGARRCMYCLDSAACDVEHYRPKSFYPEFTFAWSNYLYACAACNKAKGSAFRLLCGVGRFEDLVRGKASVAQPPPGEPLLLDPRSEDPLDYLWLDLEDTYYFLPLHPAGTFAYERAEYTIACLRLNDRGFLPRARREAYLGYRARLREYISKKGTPAVAEVVESIRRCHHRSVWVEMKRQAAHIRELGELFSLAPEAEHL